MSEAQEIIDEMSVLHKYIVLLASANENEPLKGNTWFQKELFLIAQNVPELNEEAGFEADMFGPFSETAVDQLQDLEMDEVIEKEGKKIKLTVLGKKIAQHIAQKIPKDVLELIKDTKNLLNDLNDKELLTFVYFTFPDLTKESLVLNDVKKNRAKIAASLFSKKKVSLQRAAEFAGVPLEKFMRQVAL